ncbi:MAG: hypothetical protein A2157_04415 [Deltaproteobacteria bacterium RBG_16_47_11]|nr:MAG: hypothetical protein A2157_04415 [Deltaproteobacteria bacterium RBG_16_47_11]
MLTDMKLVRGVKKIVDHVCNIKKGERVLIVTDTAMPPHIPNLFGIVAEDRGAKVFLMTYNPPKFQGAEPPKMIAAAMKESDVILEVGSVFIGHSEARHNALAVGARWQCMAQMNDLVLMHPSGLDANFHAFKPVAEKIVAYETKAKSIKITARGGTNFTANIEGRPARALRGICHQPGNFEAAPNIEASITPIEGTANGVVVVDGFADMVGGNAVERDPIKIFLKDGVAVKFEGGRADIIRRTLEEANEPDAFQCAEIGIGFNPKCINAHNQICESEGVYGSAHIALGTSPWPESTLRTPLHMDLVFHSATVEMDGKIIVKDGDLIPEIKGNLFQEVELVED